MKSDNSIRIKRTFSPQNCNVHGIDALILDAFFKSKERAKSWWSSQALKVIKLEAEEVCTVEFQDGDTWPYHVRVIVPAPKEWALIAQSCREGGNEVEIKTTEILDGQYGVERGFN